MSDDKSIIKGEVKISEKHFGIVQDSKTISAEILSDETDSNGLRTIYLDRRIHDTGEHQVDGFQIQGVYTSILTKLGKPTENQLIKPAANPSGQTDLFSII